MLFLQVHTDREWVASEKIYTSPPPPSQTKLTITPLPISGHPIQILDIFQTIPLPCSLDGNIFLGGWGMDLF